MRWDGTDVLLDAQCVSEVGTICGQMCGMCTPDGGLCQNNGECCSGTCQNGACTTASVPWPTISVGETSTFPNKKLTDIGGQFPAWSADGKQVHWSVGNAHVVYDLERGRAFDDSVRRANRTGAVVAGDSAAGGGAGRGGAEDGRMGRSIVRWKREFDHGGARHPEVRLGAGVVRASSP
jgi:hypothetical protein